MSRSSKGDALPVPDSDSRQPGRNIAILVPTFVVMFMLIAIGAVIVADSNYESFPSNSTECIDEAEARGFAIMNDLIRYYNNHQQFPTTLFKLEAWLGTPLPRCPAGLERWEYGAYDAMDSCSIGFCLNEDCYPCHFLDSDRPAEWFRDY